MSEILDRAKDIERRNVLKAAAWAVPVVAVATAAPLAAASPSITKDSGGEWRVYSVAHWPNSQRINPLVLPVVNGFSGVVRVTALSITMNDGDPHTPTIPTGWSAIVSPNAITFSGVTYQDWRSGVITSITVTVALPGGGTQNLTWSAITTESARLYWSGTFAA